MTQFEIVEWTDTGHFYTIKLPPSSPPALIRHARKFITSAHHRAWPDDTSTKTWFTSRTASATIVGCRVPIPDPHWNPPHTTLASFGPPPDEQDIAEAIAFCQGDD